MNGGRWKKGQSGNPGGRPKAVVEIRGLARLHTSTAVKVLVEVCAFPQGRCRPHRPDGAGLPAWQETIFAAMERNSAYVSDFFNLPRNNVVEIGRQVEI
jgi:K+ transporter